MYHGTIWYVLLRQSIVGLASEATVRACEMIRNHKHTDYFKAGYYRGLQIKQHQKRLWQFVKNPTCPWGKGKRTSTATTRAGPEGEKAASGRGHGAGHQTEELSPFEVTEHSARAPSSCRRRAEALWRAFVLDLTKSVF